MRYKSKVAIASPRRPGRRNKLPSPHKLNPHPGRTGTPTTFTAVIKSSNSIIGSNRPSVPSGAVRSRRPHWDRENWEENPGQRIYALVRCFLCPCFSPSASSTVALVSRSCVHTVQAGLMILPHDRPLSMGDDYDDNDRKRCACVCVCTGTIIICWAAV